MVGRQLNVLSDDLVSNSDDQKQLLMTLREAYRKKQFQNAPHPHNRKSGNLPNLSIDHKQTPVVAFGATEQLVIRKKERVLSKKIERSSFGMPPFTPLQTIFRICQQTTGRLQQQFPELPMWIKSLFSVQLLLSKETSLPEYELGRDWEYSENCNELISM